MKLQRREEALPAAANMCCRWETLVFANSFVPAASLSFWAEYQASQGLQPPPDVSRECHVVGPDWAVDPGGDVLAHFLLYDRPNLY